MEFDMDRVTKLVDQLTDEEIETLKMYLRDISSSSKQATATIEIPYKFPTCNDYTNACRKNRYAGANMKRKVQMDIGYFINKLPEFKGPVVIDFVWCEPKGNRDPDNVAFAKKFVLDSLVECGKLKDDNRKIVTAFRDSFDNSKDEWNLTLTITEV